MGLEGTLKTLLASGEDEDEDEGAKIVDAAHSKTIRLKNADGRKKDESTRLKCFWPIVGNIALTRPFTFLHTPSFGTPPHMVCTS